MEFFQVVLICEEIVLPCAIFHSPKLHMDSLKMWSLSFGFFLIER